MKGLLNAVRMLLALRCDESTRLVSDGVDRTLSPLERWSVRLHAVSCGACRRFRRQIAILQRAATSRAAQPAQLSPEARQRIEAALRQAEP